MIVLSLLAALGVLCTLLTLSPVTKDQSVANFQLACCAAACAGLIVWILT